MWFDDHFADHSPCATECARQTVLPGGTDMLLHLTRFYAAVVQLYNTDVVIAADFKAERSKTIKQSYMYR